MAQTQPCNKIVFLDATGTPHLSGLVHAEASSSDLKTMSTNAAQRRLQAEKTELAESKDGAGVY